MAEYLSDSATRQDCFLAVNRFTDLLDTASVEAGVEFLRTIEQHQSKANCELSLFTARGVRRFVFSGFKSGDHIVLVGAPAAEGTGETLSKASTKRRKAGLPAGAQNADEFSDRLNHKLHELMNARRELAKKNEHLMELAQEKTDLLREAAHDLRNPVSGILNASEVLLEDLGDTLGSDHSTLLRAIHTSSRAMSRLIEDVLQISGIDSENRASRPQSTEPIRLVEHGILSNRVEANSKNVRVEVSSEGTLPRVRVDISQFSRVFESLIEYAIQASSIGGRVAVHLAGRGNTCTISVHNEGPEVPSVGLRTLFACGPGQRMRRKGSAWEGRSFLQLAIAKRIVEEHGGRIEVRTGQPTGLTFIVSLPVQNKGHRRPVESAGGSGFRRRAAG